MTKKMYEVSVSFAMWESLSGIFLVIFSFNWLQFMGFCFRSERDSTTSPAWIVELGICERSNVYSVHSPFETHFIYLCDEYLRSISLLGAKKSRLRLSNKDPGARSSRSRRPELRRRGVKASQNPEI